MLERALLVALPPFLSGVALENVSTEASGIHVAQVFQTFRRLIPGATLILFFFSPIVVIVSPIVVTVIVSENPGIGLHKIRPFVEIHLLQ
jgi:hypothetical protein